MRNGIPGRIAGAMLLACAALTAAAPRPVHAEPAIGALTAGTGSIGRYNPLELAFPVSTDAVNPFLPYDSSAPSYAANLRPTEDARRGVSVDALLLPPGETDWSKAQTWPCFWQEDFNVAGIPTGDAEWHLRFAPTQTGTWHYELRATDASGTVTTAPATFSCVDSASRGFIHVSPTDTRYFEYSDGTPFIAAGANIAYNTWPAIMAGIHAGGGTGLLRYWISATGILGGMNNSGEDLSGYAGSIVFSDARTGRYSLSMPWNQGFGPQLSFATVSGASYTLTGYIKKAAGSNGTPQLYTSVGNGVTVGSPDANGWQEQQVHFTAANNKAVINLGVIGLTSGAMLLDDVTVTGTNGADLLGGAGGFEDHVNYEQAAAARIDTLVQTAQANGQFLKLACVNKFDQFFGSIANDGTSTSNWFGSHQALGNSTDPNADTPCQRFQRYYARYIVARWGAYSALHSLEYVNEMDDYDGIDYAGAQAFAHYVHTYTRDGSTLGHILCTSSSDFNNAGVTYDPNFYESLSLYSDIDYADYHFYTDSDDIERGPSLPYDDAIHVTSGAPYNARGGVRVTSGGPNGLGKYRFTLVGQKVGDQNNLSAWWFLPTIRGAGTWHFSYWVRKDAGAIVGTPQMQFHASFLPGGYVQDNAHGNTVITTSWQQVTGTFTVPDNNPHFGASFWMYASLGQNTPTGTGVEFADIRVTAPDGLPFFRVTFSEPRMDQDSASLASYLAGGKASYSGDPAIGKPFVLGETELLGSLFPSLTGATAGPFARQAFYGSMLSPFAQYTQFWHEAATAITAAGGWKYEGGVERFLKGVPLSNGHYRDLGATASPTLRVVGQKDAQAGNAVFWVQNQGPSGDGSEAADWLNLAKNPAAMQSVTGTVAIPGLPSGSYEADVWNTSTGQFVSSLFLATSGGVLTVPIAGLGADAAVKVFPANSAHIALHLTASPSVVKPGSKITFTLTYVNQGASPALGVNLPWPIPVKTHFVWASSGGTYDATQDTVTWLLGTLPAGASGKVTLIVTAL